MKVWDFFSLSLPSFSRLEAAARRRQAGSNNLPQLSLTLIGLDFSSPPIKPPEDRPVVSWQLGEAEDRFWPHPTPTWPQAPASLHLSLPGRAIPENLPLWPKPVAGARVAPLGLFASPRSPRAFVRGGRGGGRGDGQTDTHPGGRRCLCGFGVPRVQLTTRRFKAGPRNG